MAVRVLAACGEAAEQRGRRVVRMAFDLGRDLERVLNRSRRRQGLVELQPGDGRRRAAAEPGSARDLAADFDPDAGRGGAEPGARAPEGRLDSILTGERAVHEAGLDHVHRVGPHLEHADVRVELHRHRQRVEPGPEIADRSGDAELVSDHK